MEVHTLERSEPARGKEEARAHFKALHKAIAQLDTTMLNGWDVAQFGIVEYTIDGEQRGPLGWIPLQRDQVVRLHVVDVNEIREGKIARVWRYDSPAEIMTPGLEPRSLKVLRGEPEWIRFGLLQVVAVPQLLRDVLLGDEARCPS